LASKRVLDTHAGTDLRRSLLDPARQLWPRTVTASQPADGIETVSTVA